MQTEKERKIEDELQERREAKSRKEKLQQADQQSAKIKDLAQKVETESSPASSILSYLKNNPATSTLTLGAATSLATGSPFMAAAMGAAAYFGAGKALDKASGGTQAMAAASAAAFMSGHPVIGAGLGIAAYAGVGKDLFKSTQEAKAENGDSPDPTKSQSPKDVALGLWDKAMGKMSGNEPQDQSKQERVRESQRA